MVEFKYDELLPLGDDDTAYRLLSTEHISTARFEGQTVLKIAPEGLEMLAEAAFTDVSHLLRPAHLAQLEKIFNDPESSNNDRYVALEMLKNAVISAEMEFPMCQDTGTAIVMGKKGQQVWTGFSDEKALSRGVFNAYTNGNLRYSQNAPLTMYEEKNTGCNLPAQVEIYATGGDAYKFLFIAKGGGSANKTYLYQETKAVLNPGTLVDFLTAKMKTLGTAACPPYHLAFVVGGTSAEFNLKTVKLASAGYLDGLPTAGSETGHGFRDLELESELLARARELGIGAQFGGKYFCHDIRVVRLPRHGASCPIGIGVSCSADRNIKAKITAEGIFLEQLETDPARFLPGPQGAADDAVPIDLNQSMDDIRAIADPIPGGHPFKAVRQNHRGPGHRPRQAQGAAGQRPGPAPVSERSHYLLCRTGQDPRRIRIRLLRPDHGRPNGFVRAHLSGRGCIHGDAGQGQPLQGGDRCLQKIRRVLPGLHRRTGRPAGQGLHYFGRGTGVP
jgi:fumarate hydratase class I